jgi:hypothetical protein
VLDANSTTAWYLAADTGAGRHGRVLLAGRRRGPGRRVRSGFDVDGIKLKGRLDFAAKAIDHRGLYKNPGA